jgi:hypothetical protein
VSRAARRALLLLVGFLSGAKAGEGIVRFISYGAERKLVNLALKGDVGSAGQLLTLRAHAIKHGDSGPMIIRVTGGLPRDHSDEE